MKVNLRSVFQLELHLLDLEDPARMERIMSPFHQMLEEFVLSRDAILEEIFEVLSIFTEIVAWWRWERFGVENLLRISGIISETIENRLAAVLAGVLSVAAVAASHPLMWLVTALCFLILFHIHHIALVYGRFFFAKVEGATSESFRSARRVLSYYWARAYSYALFLFSLRKASVLAPSLACMAASRSVSTTCLTIYLLDERSGL